MTDHWHPGDAREEAEDKAREKTLKDIKARHSRYVRQNVMVWLIMVVLLVSAFIEGGPATTLLLLLIAWRVEDIRAAHSMTAEMTEDVSERLADYQISLSRALMGGDVGRGDAP